MNERENKILVLTLAKQLMLILRIIQAENKVARATANINRSKKVIDIYALLVWKLKDAKKCFTGLSFPETGSL